MTYLPLFLSTLSDKINRPFSVFLMGMGAAFILILVAFAAAAVLKIFSIKDKSEKNDSEPDKATVSEVEIDAANELCAEEASGDAIEETEDLSVIAAICAAIEAYRAEEGLAMLPYRVVSFKRRNSGKSRTDIDG